LLILCAPATSEEEDAHLENEQAGFGMPDRVVDETAFEASAAELMLY
jgi:hypothetical protein